MGDAHHREQGYLEGSTWGAWSLKLSMWVSHIPHVVIFLEEHVILHSPLLKLYVHTAPIDGDHLADMTGQQRGQ